MIVPTGTCFDDALDFFGQVLTPKQVFALAQDFSIVHGICLSQETKTPYAHAWVEQRNALGGNTIIWQAGVYEGDRVYYAMALGDFEEDFIVQTCTRYTLTLALKMNDLWNNFGPWRKDYLALCRQQHEDPTIPGFSKRHQPVVVVKARVSA